MTDGATTSHGRKVVFLHPHSVVADGLINAIAEQEYEVHRVHDHQKLRAVLEHPELRNALLFINIDEELPEPEWERYIRGVRESPQTRGVHIGILSYNEDSGLAAKYLMDIGVQAGYIRLSLGLEESTRIVLSALAATEAKGQRRHVRADCRGILNVSLSASYLDKEWRGELLDLSIAGMACVFDTDPGMKTDARLRGVQLNLRGSRVTVDGTVKGMRTVNSRRIYVVVFDQPLAGQTRDRMIRFIHDCLQIRLERLMESGGRVGSGSPR